MTEGNQESKSHFEILPQLFKNSLQLPAHPILSQSVARLVGDYCVWISKEAIELLGPSLQLIIQFLSLSISSSNSNLAFSASLLIYTQYPYQLKQLLYMMCASTQEKQ